MAVLDLRCCAGFSVAAASVGYSLVAACWLLIVGLLLLQSTGSKACGFSSCDTQA